MNKTRKAKGFTIIEVVLVLAIAGLIFLMVFIALPALQRSQRDTQRKNDLSRAQTAIASYSSNNRGALPGAAATNWNPPTANNLITAYLTPNASDTFLDPLGANSSQAAGTNTYLFTPSVVTPLAGSFDSAVNQNVIYYSLGYTCGTTGDSIVVAGNRKVALRMYLEGGGITCVNN